MSKIFKALLTVSLAIGSMSAGAQATGLPKKLTGTWTTVDGKATGAMELNADPVSGKATLNVQSSYGVCTIKEAPATVSAEGDKLTVQVDPAWSNACRKDISIELVRKAGSQDYEGQLRQGGRARESNPVLNVKLGS